MSDITDVYLIWSAEHQAWWSSGGCGYVRHLSKAGRYTRADAIAISTHAIPGTAEMMGAIPEIPVRLEDIEVMQSLHRSAFPGREPERWE